MTLSRYRTTAVVNYSNAAIPIGVVLDAVDPTRLTEWGAEGIRQQVRRSKGDKGLGIPADPVIVIAWAGMHRTVPLRFLARID